MVKPVSEQLANLSVRAKRAEDSVAAAKGQAAGTVEKREDEIRAADEAEENVHDVLHPSGTPFD